MATTLPDEPAPLVAWPRGQSLAHSFRQLALPFGTDRQVARPGLCLSDQLSPSAPTRPSLAHRLTGYAKTPTAPKEDLALSAGFRPEAKCALQRPDTKDALLSQVGSMPSACSAPQPPHQTARLFGEHMLAASLRPTFHHL